MLNAGVRKVCLLALIFVCVQGWSQVVTSLGDFRTGDDPYPILEPDVTTFDGKGWYRFGDGHHGRELWVSDGTAAGTQLFMDLYPGGTSSFPSDMVVFQGALYFTAATPDYGRALWRTDGTVAGTQMVVDLQPGPNGFALDMVAAGSWLYLHAGYDLYRTDGTQAGTSKLDAEFVTEMMPMGSLMFYYDEATTYSTYLVDDSTGGISLFADHQIHLEAEMNGYVYYHFSRGASYELWRTNGTQSELLATLNSDVSQAIYGSAVLGNTLVFAAHTIEEGIELWSTDGTTGGTGLLEAVLPGNLSGVLSYEFIDTGDKALFGGFANDEQTLWVTDGTSAGTQQVADLDPNSASLEGILDLGPVSGGHLLGTTIDSQPHLFRTDGTAAGTSTVTVLDGNIYLLGARFSLNNTAYWMHTDPTVGRELFKSDGTAANTGEVTDANTAQYSSLRDHVKLGDFSLWHLRTGESSWGVYSSNGYAGHHEQLLTSRATRIEVVGNQAYIHADGSWYVTEGTAATTRYFTWGVTVYNFFSFGEDTFVSYADGLYTTNPGGFQERISLYDLGHYNFHMVDMPGNPTVIDDTMYFFARNSASELRIFKSGGTPGTTEALDTFIGIYGFLPSEFVRMGNYLYFTVPSPEFGSELFSLNLTTDEIALVVDLYPGTGWGDPQDLTVLGDKLIFSASSENEGRELWVSDGTAAGTELLADINPGTADSLHWSSFGSNSLNNFNVFNGKVYFSAASPNGTEVWATDGTAGGTAELADIMAGPLGSNPTNFAVHDGALYFAASDGIHGNEWWRTDGTAAGTSLYYDLLPGPKGGNPWYPVSLTHGLVFFGDSGNTGLEPRVIRALPLATFNTSETSFCRDTGRYAAGALEFGGIHTWSITGGTIHTGQTLPAITFSVDGPGTLTLTHTVEMNGLSNSSTQNFTIYDGAPAEPTGLVGPTLVCPGEENLIFSIDNAADASAWAWEVPAGAQIIGDPTGDTIEVWIGNEGGEVRVRALNACGESAWASMTVDLYEIAPAFAGADQVVCDTTASLAANEPGTSSGTWTILSGQGGVLSDPGDPNATLTGVVNEVYLLEWNLSHGSCGDDTDTVVISFAEGASDAEAGEDILSCFTWAVLDATAPSNGYGVWEVVEGEGGSFENSFDPKTVFNGRAGTTYTLRWNVRAKPCPIQSDDVLVTMGTHQAMDAGPDRCHLANGDITLEASAGAGTWEVVSGPSLNASQFTDVADPTSGFVPDEPGIYVLRRYHASGCGTLEDQVELTISPAQPLAQFVTGVGDIPYNSSSNPEGGIRFGDYIYFTAERSLLGRELYRSNGVTTELVADLNPGDTQGSGSSPRFMRVIGDNLYFWANGGQITSLYALNLHTEQLKIVLDDVGGSSMPIAHNGYGWFSKDGSLWRTDGKSIEPMLPASAEPLTSYNGHLIYKAVGQLWAGDGTVDGSWSITPGVNNINVSTPFKVVGDKLLFFADNGHGYQLWCTDGTAEGTGEVKRINGAGSAASQTDAVVYNNLLFFTANDGIHGQELWRSDGTEQGTYLVQDFEPGPNGGLYNNTDLLHALPTGVLVSVQSQGLWIGDGSPDSFTLIDPENHGAGGMVMGDHFYYAGGTYTTTGTELYRTDGTVAGTELVHDIFPGSSSSSPYFMGTLDNRIIFNAYEERGQELWSSDGTSAGTVLAKDIAISGTSSLALRPGVWQNRIAFGLAQAFNDLLLVVSDGTSTGTQTLSMDDLPNNFTSGAGGIWFTTSGTTNSLWRTDGTLAGTQVILSGTSSYDHLHVLGDLLIFSYDAGDGRELYATSGTVGESWSLGEWTPGSEIPHYRDGAIYNGKLYMPIKISNVWQVLETDGSLAGTRLLPAFADLIPSFNTPTIGVTSTHLYYGARDLHVTQDVDQTPQQLVGPSYPTSFVPLGNRMFLGENNRTWSSDGTSNGTVSIDVFNMRVTWEEAIVFEGQVIAPAVKDSVTGLFVSDGTADGTEFATLPTWTNQANPRNLTIFNGQLVLAAQSDQKGYELWSGTLDCMARISDLAPGADYLPVAGLVASDELLFMLGMSEEHILELATVEAAIVLADPTLQVWLLDNYDTNGDGILDRSEASSITHLDLSDMDITTLSGIGSLPNLRSLTLAGNPINDISPLLSSNLGTQAGDLLDLSLMNLDEDDCDDLQQLQARVDASGAQLLYQTQGGTPFMPSQEQWPTYNILELLSGAASSTYSLDCGTQIGSAPPPDGLRQNRVSRAQGGL